jgi:hypothetical protein
VAGCIEVDQDGAMLRNRFGLPRCTLGCHVTYRELLIRPRGFKQPACFWRRSAFLSSGGLDKSLRFCMDHDLFFRLSKRMRSGSVHRFIACFRQHGDSKSATLQNVREEEDALLRSRYGYEAYPRLYRRILWYYYYLVAYLLAGILNLRLLFRLTTIPPVDAVAHPKVQVGAADS